MAIKHTLKGLKASARAHGEGNDCAVKAIAVTCRVSYSRARRELARAGRMPGEGAESEQIRDAVRACGHKMVNTQRALRGTELRKLKLPTGARFIVDTFNHVAAWDGEALVDVLADSQRAVVNIYRVEKVTK